MYKSLIENRLNAKNDVFHNLCSIIYAISENISKIIIYIKNMQIIAHLFLALPLYPGL